MRPDLQAVEISLGELNKFTGLTFSQKADGIFVNYINWKKAFSLFFGGILLVIFSLGFLPIFMAGTALFFWGIFSLIMSVIGLLFPKRFNFIKEVNQHNEIILNINTLDQIEAIGNPVKLNEREKVIEALRINRDNLVRALQTDKILRENPDFKPEYFNIDLTGLRALQASEQATEYGRFLNDVLEVGVNVQTKIRKLENQRLR